MCKILKRQCGVLYIYIANAFGIYIYMPNALGLCSQFIEILDFQGILKLDSLDIVRLHQKVARNTIVICKWLYVGVLTNIRLLLNLVALCLVTLSLLASVKMDM